MARLMRIAGCLLGLGVAALDVATSRVSGTAWAADPKSGPAVKGAPAAQPEPTPPSAVPAPATPPASAQRRTQQWPVIVNEPRLPPQSQWTKAEIEAAQSQCALLLSGIDAVVIPANPVREGECGAAHPVELISVGRAPQVTMSQPVLVTCEMASALSRWMKESVQPAARKHLGSPVIRIQIMSAYSCRNAYGRKKSRLSEHGRANALDIRGFLTERNIAVDVAGGWGMTARDVRAQVAAEAARREAEKRAADLRAAQAKAARAANGKAPAAANPPLPSDSAPSQPDVLRGPIADTRPAIEIPKLPELGTVRREPNAFGLNPPSRLGGPKAAARDAQRQGDTTTAYQAFMRQIHAEACKYFGTVLGPESNDAHRDHFHVDMAERALGSFCE